MKDEEKFLITGLLLTVLGYALYKIWKPEEKAKPLAGLIQYDFTKPERPTPPANIVLDDLERLRESVTASLKQ